MKNYYIHNTNLVQNKHRCFFMPCTAMVIFTQTLLSQAYLFGHRKVSYVVIFSESIMFPFHLCHLTINFIEWVSYHSDISQIFHHTLQINLWLKQFINNQYPTLTSDCAHDRQLLEPKSLHIQCFSHQLSASLGSLVHGIYTGIL